MRKAAQGLNAPEPSPATASRRAPLGAAAVLPLAALPAVAAAASPDADAELLRLEAAILAVDAHQEELVEPEDAAWRLPDASRQRRAIARQRSALSDEWHRLHGRVIDTPATTEAGRKAKARVALRYVCRDSDGWPLPEDALIWSLARDALGDEAPALPVAQA